MDEPQSVIPTGLSKSLKSLLTLSPRLRHEDALKFKGELDLFFGDERAVRFVCHFRLKFMLSQLSWE